MFNITPKLKALKDDISMLIKGIKLLHILQPWLMHITAITALFSSTYPFVNIFMSSVIIDELTTSRNLNKLIFYVAITISLNFIISLMLNGLSHIKEIHANLLNNKQEMKLNSKVLTMDFEHAENPQIQLLRRKISESRNMNGGGIWHLVYGFDTLIKSMITITISVVFAFNLFIMHNLPPKL